MSNKDLSIMADERLLAEKQALEAKLAAAVAALEAIEWVRGFNHMGDLIAACPKCGNSKYSGHASNCKLAAALTKAREQ